MFGNRVLREMFGRKRKEQQTGKKRGASGFVLLTKYYSGDQITEDEMGGVCGTYG